MKKQLSILFLFPFFIFSQAKQYLEFNDVQALITSDGFLFYDEGMGLASYNVPKASISPASSIFICSFLSMGKVNEVLKGVGNTYSDHEFISGPIATNYTAGNYFQKYSLLWSVNQSEINLHILNWNQVDYITPSSILNWPGNGDVSNGESKILAPFKDLNGNQLYEPLLGEYPLIRGDRAIYSIMNDENCSHVASGLTPLRQEIHVMAYQFASNDCLNQTTFIHFEIFNRSSDIYTEFKFGLFNDYDLGYYSDDFVGSDSNLSLSYVYNGDSNDDNFNTIPHGYGINPPAFGCMELNHDLSSNIQYDSVNNNIELYNNLNGLKGDGTSFLDALNTPTNFIYDNSVNSAWNELAEGNLKGDRKNVLGTTMCTINPSESICRDFAFIYARSSSYISGLESVDLLKVNAAIVQNFYDSLAYSCTPMAGIKELNTLNCISVYPNPTEKMLTISIAGEFSYSIVSIDGKLIQEGKTNESKINVESLNSGVYYLEMISEKGVSTTQFTKK